jgi:AAA15 family ATPase/GTPase
MNITHFHVSGFKAVDELEVESKNTNLITGRNKSGKTISA